MNKIISDIKKIMNDCIEKYIPDISINNLEDNGAIWKHITAPVGTKLIRVSSDEFEVDNNDKEIYMEKM